MENQSARPDATTARVSYELPPDDGSPPRSPGQVVIRTPPPAQKPWQIRKVVFDAKIPEYSNPLSMYFGFALCAIGALAFIFGIVLFAIGAGGANSSIGIWSGIFYIGAGILGVLSFKWPEARWILACFTLALVAFVIGFIAFVLACVFTDSNSEQKQEYLKGMKFWSRSEISRRQYEELAKAEDGHIAVTVLLIICALAAMGSAAVLGFFSGKVFVIRGPQNQGPESRYSANNPIPASGQNASVALNQEWGEYNPQPRATGQEWGEYNPKPRVTGQEWGEYNPKPRGQPPVSNQHRAQEWNEYTPARQRPPSREPMSDAATHGEGHKEDNSGGGQNQVMAGGVIMRKATGTVDVDEDVPHSGYRGTSTYSADYEGPNIQIQECEA